MINLFAHRFKNYQQCLDFYPKVACSVPVEVTQHKSVKVGEMSLRLHNEHASFFINDRLVSLALQMTCPPLLKAEAAQYHDTTTEGPLESCIFLTNISICIDSK